jgi:putative nucleotidyltransferase with HDIG domain
MCGLIEVLSKAVHAQDAYKRDHCERVSAIAVGLAQKMGQQDAEELQLVRIAGLVHDIGNAGLPVRLFQKHGRFRDGERKLMQQHCGLGAEIIGGVAEMERLADIVRHHHEQYDGRGYPEGLAGCAIPFESRLIAVADTYVAMTSPRPYRPTLSHDEAVRQIEQGAGEQFDPAIVDAFLEWVTQSEFTPNGPSGHSPPPVPAKAAFCQA